MKATIFARTSMGAIFKANVLGVTSNTAEEIEVIKISILVVLCKRRSRVLFANKNKKSRERSTKIADILK